MTPSLLIGVDGSRRHRRFDAALAALGRPPCEVLSWRALLARPTPGDPGPIAARLEGTLSPGMLLRIDSPGEDFETWQALVAAGDGPLSGEPARSLEEDRGRIRCGAQWYSGLRRALAQVDRALNSERLAGAVRPMNAPGEIALMFDKARCQRHLAAQGVPVPPILTAPESYAALRAAMAEHPRVFLKPRHGSSASGVLALERGPGGRVQAWTSVEYTPEGALYNNLRVRRVRDERSLEGIVEGLIPEGVHLEGWVPKASFQGHSLDLRVLCIAGRPRHVVPRLSRTPITNLHLGNARGDAGALRAAVGEARWGEVMDLCARAAAGFPRSLYVGLDVLLTPGWGRALILEANAFGDLLPGALSEGEDPWLAELRALA